MADIVIIGAGLTGLSAAYHLEQKGIHSYTLFEKESEIGGLCRSVTQQGFTFDYTGHLLHANDPYFHELLTKIVGLDSLHLITRRSFIYSHGTYTHYPFQVNLHGLPLQVIAECIEKYVQRNKLIRNPKTFLDWVEKHFGAGFGRHFFVPYQKKIFAYDLNKISASWTSRFVPSTSLEQIIEGIMQASPTEPIGYNARFYYPKQGGIISWVESFARQIKKPIMLNHTVQSIDVKNKKIHFTNGHTQSYSQLISTIPLNHLLNSLENSSDLAIHNASQKLLCNSVINFNLGIARPDLSDKHWIYFPENQFPFYRLGFYHNFAPSLVPKNCSSLYGEFAHIGKSPEWIAKKLSTSLNLVKNLFDIKNEEIITQKTINISHGYVIYDQWREKNLSHIHTRLNEKSIYSIGRYGAWKYSSMQEAVLDGKQIADLLTILPARQIKNAKTAPQSITPNRTYYHRETTHD